MRHYKNCMTLTPWVKASHMTQQNAIIIAIASKGTDIEDVVTNTRPDDEMAINCEKWRPKTMHRIRRNMQEHQKENIQEMTMVSKSLRKVTHDRLITFLDKRAVKSMIKMRS